MKIYVVGNSNNKFKPLNNIRKCFYTNEKHNGENADFLNPWYCELTGIYYMWKNETDDIVGLEHYRRYFVNEKLNLLNENEIKNILSESDIILRKWDYIKLTKCRNSWSYLDNNTKEYILKFLNTLNDDEKAFILNDLQTSTYFAQCNMFICKKQIIDDYCNWFFNHSVCFTCNDLVKYPRCVGYVSEFIFGSYIKMKKLKIHWQQSIEYDKNLKQIIGVF